MLEHADKRSGRGLAVATGLLLAAFCVLLQWSARGGSEMRRALLEQRGRQQGAAAGARGGRIVEPRVGQRMSRVDVHEQHPLTYDDTSSKQPLVSAQTVRAAMLALKGKRLNLKAALQQLRYTGRYGDTSYVVQASKGDPATVYAHNSIWPSIVKRKMPYVEAVHGDGTPYMQPLTVYAPPGGNVVTSVIPGTSARPPIPTRYALLPEASNAPLDNTVYKCAPSGYMVGPVGYHCSPACKDSGLWRSDYGGCSLYRDTPITSNGFKDYCGTDKDTAGVPAAVACPVSCGTCGIGMCYDGALFKKCKLSTYSTDSEEVRA